MGFTNSGVAGTVTALGTTFWIATGTSDTVFAKTQTTLVSEITAGEGLERAAATVTVATTTVANDTISATKSFSVTGTKTVKEVALLDAASTGTMYSRTVLTTPRSLVSGDTLVVTNKLIFAC